MGAASGPFLARFGFLFPPASWPAARLEPFLAALELRRMEGGAVIIRPGQACQALPFVLSGSIRVFTRAESGREISLYRVEAGESCMLSTACLGEGRAFPAFAAAEGPTTAAFLPAPRARELLSESPEFRDYMFSLMADRFAGVLELVQEVAFRRVDERLAQWLAERASGTGALPAGGPEEVTLKSTHQELAAHLGTSREVVSRILKDWEGRGWLSLSRGGISVRLPFPPPGSEL